MTKLSFERMEVTGYRPVQTQEKPPVLFVETAAAPIAYTPEDTQKTLEQLIDEISSMLPPRTAAFGVCGDGLPVLFDLTDPLTGPILVVGDPGCGKTRLLHVLLKSAVAFNAPHVVKFLVLSPKPEEFSEMATQGTRSGHCLGVYKDESLQAEEWIFRISALVERRLNSRQLNPPVLLAVDDLQFITRVSSEVRLNFEWILKHGPSVQVWPVVTLPTEAAARMSRWTGYFRTRMLGKMPAAAAERLGPTPGLDTSRFEPLQLAVFINDAWLQFRLPGGG